MRTQPPGPRIHTDWKVWGNQLVEWLKKDKPTGAIQLPIHTVTELPSAEQAGLLIYLTDETGGATVAFSDGASWRRVQDLAVVS